MSDNDAKANAKLQEAEKKMKKSGGFLSFLGGCTNITEAAELYIQAANLFKVSKNWNSSGNTFLKVAQLFEREGDSKHDAAMNYNEAGNCFRKVDIQKGIGCFTKAAEIYTDMGRFNMAAKTYMMIAELYESDSSEKQRCMAEYEKAADFFKGEESKSSASKCMAKVAQIAAEMEQYQKAVEVFEEIGVYEADHQTLKYNAKTHFFQALLCYLCIDTLEAQRALKRYEDLAPFADSREFKLVKELIATLEQNDVDGFTAAVAQHDKMNRLDAWFIMILAKIKRGFNAEEEEDLR